jgi:hypothetical protein
VTVPFVLSTGIGFSKAVGAEEGFGILTCASVSPIITVLIVDILRRAMKSPRAPGSAPVVAVSAELSE